MSASFLNSEVFQGGFDRQNCLQMEASCFSCDGAAAFMLVCCGSASGLRYQSGSASSVVVLHRNDWLVSAELVPDFADDFV